MNINNYYQCVIYETNISCKLCRAKPKVGICWLVKWADTAFSLCGAEMWDMYAKWHSVVSSYNKTSQQTRGVTSRWPNVGPMLVHHLRRCPSISPTLVRRLVFVGFLAILQRKKIVVDTILGWFIFFDVCSTLPQNRVDVLCVFVYLQRLTNIGLMLVHILRRWPSIDTTYCVKVLCLLAAHLQRWPKLVHRTRQYTELSVSVSGERDTGDTSEIRQWLNKHPR